MQNINFLSVVVPAYKQEKTIARDIKNLDDVLSKLTYKYEIIVVVDGLLDKTFDNAKKTKKNYIKVFGYKENQGKGHAVRYGMLKSRGDVVGFMDGGMDISPTGISLLLDSMLWQDADIMIGSKLHPDSKVNYPVFRRILSWGYRTLTHIFFEFSIRDTQVGLKFFRREVVEKVFPKLLVKTFAFDVEILAVANSMGFKKIYEGPVELNFDGESSITSKNFWVIIFLMLWDTIAIFYRLKIIRYYGR
ncbi:MAG: glycosyltransferase [Candidatus Levybacteria bacterium]|nr:glycosyltransferase [Candidatus Levybacteria bacterium]